MSNSSAEGDASYQQIKRLNQIGIALSSQRDKRQLLSLILTSARELTGAEAGTLYIRETSTLYMRETDVPSLRFDIVQNDRLNINLGGRDQSPVDNFPPIPLLTEDGKPNDKMVVAWSVNNNRTVNIPDAYAHEGFDFSGTRAFDQRTGYRSCSFLTVPLSDHDGHVIAALQLINKLNDKGKISAFTQKDQELAESLASQAAMAIINQRLINEMKTLFDSFTRVIATAIDSKSPHTGNHCRRVPDATLMLAEAASRSNHPALSILK
ncbi:GAF domain-containing protein [Nitrincola nitratireducens]|uniref:Signal transduction protein containing GAF and PtsI domain n=1 Tax=Nitrincola nitratireducens TaxID=1229521 RepID=W9VJ28_9GAMM|nr:GAF domain-containing protein [Nitrincola nitratireducens]EXJ10580.1 Signal transduction protein containing GAF and PtsI domain [Nitrincola nitratireducens]